uniref:ATP-dependent DNA helicase n=1 Tax=Rhabditophanes sp. KR3021 TaxID=114890 RepID=A0AC35UE44_9BILA
MKIQLCIIAMFIGFLMAQQYKILYPQVVKCAANRTYTNCGGCEDKCSDKEPMSCRSNCRLSGCYCTGLDFAVDDRGYCIQKKDCPIKIEKCLHNYVYMQCGPKCANVCGKKTFWCDPNCGRPGCYCTGKYSLVHEKGRKCVLTTSCSDVKTKEIPDFPLNELMTTNKKRVTVSRTAEDDSTLIHFERVQFPIALVYAMTIHKPQGGTFDRVGLDLSEDVFAHGMLYVGLSRCTSADGLFIKLKNVEPSVKFRSCNTFEL